MKFIKCILLATLVVAIVSCSKKDEAEIQKTDTIYDTAVKTADETQKGAAALPDATEDAVIMTAGAATPAQKKDSATQSKNVLLPPAVKKVNALSGSSNSLIYITSESDFDAKIIKSAKPALVDFYADWCGPCRMLAPTIKQLADEYAGKVIVAKVNVDKNRLLSGKYKVGDIPCVILFKDGKEVDRIVGLRKIESYKEALSKVLKNIK